MLILYSAERVADRAIRQADRTRCAWRATRPSSIGRLPSYRRRNPHHAVPKGGGSLVGFRLVPSRLAQSRQHPFNGILHAVKFRVLERVDEIQVDRNVAVSNIQRSIRVAEPRAHAEADPCVAVRLATGWVAVYSNKVGPRCSIFIQAIPEAAPQRDIAADLPQFVQSSAVRDFPHCPPVDLLILAGFEHSGTAKMRRMDCRISRRWPKRMRWSSVTVAVAVYASVSAFQHISGPRELRVCTNQRNQRHSVRVPPGSRSDCAESA